jgi:hypothetical protein
MACPCQLGRRLVAHGETVNSYSIQELKVAYVKTSDEPVFVLALQKDTNGVLQAIVRRPTQTENGVVHTVDTFFAAELHSAQEKVVEEFEMQKFMLSERDRMTKERQEANTKDNAQVQKESFLN